MTKAKRRRQNHRQLQSMLELYQNRDNDFPVVKDTIDLPDGHKGPALHINDHGNVTLYMCFKNGTNRELGSLV